MKELESYSYSNDCLGKDILPKFELEARRGRSRGNLRREMVPIDNHNEFEVQCALIESVVESAGFSIASYPGPFPLAIREWKRA